MIDKEIIVYASQPFKKYRWISYLSVIQVGFLTLNLFVLPTNKLIEQRVNAIKNKVRKKQSTEKSDTSLDEYEPNPDYDSSTLVERLKKLNYRELFTVRSIYNNVTERPLLSASAVTASILITTALFTYARRIVHMIVLLPNERVRIFCFSAFAFGKPKAIELPASHISCVSPRKSPHNYSIIKLKNHYGFHLVNKTEGHFLEPKLYDKYLGFQRSWAK